jgi:hypothetical protein
VITLLGKLWTKMLYDEMAAARWWRGFLLWFAGMALSILAFPVEVVQTWGPRDWAYRAAVAGVMGAAGMITAGQKNEPKASP